jgi:hypothetical protein
VSQRRLGSLAPLIGSTEGIASTPAYRGLSLAVFENLELAEFGNRIPFLTFEVVADADAPTVGEILSDSSSGAIADVGGRSVVGYACYGASIKAAVKPLVDCAAIDLLDDGLQLKSASLAVVVISDLDLGYSADGQASSKIQREQAPARDVPTSLRLSYYDPALDYQAGESRASAGEKDGKEERIELPAVLGAGAAKSLVEEAMARVWAKRDKLTLRLPPAHLGLEPGMRLEVPVSPSHWTVETCNIESFVVIAEVRPSREAGAALVADSGRIASNPDVVVGEMALALLETPAALSLPNAPSVMLAASSLAEGWKSRGVEVSVGDQRRIVRTAARKSKLGRALSALTASDDTTASVDVEMVDASQWLVSCDDDALAEGANAAILGREIIQFGDSVPIGPGRFRLSRLLRGRDRTGWAMAGHATNEWFVLIEADALRVIEFLSWSIGSEASAKAIGAGPGAAEAQAPIGWGGLRPLSGSALLLEGVQVVGARCSAIATPTGGATVDTEARSALDQLLGALRQHGLIEM